MRTLLLVGSLAGLALAIWFVAQRQEANAPTGPLAQPPAPGFNPGV